MNIFYLFFLVYEDSNTNRVPQDLAVSLIGSTDFFDLREKMQSIHVKPLIFDCYSLFQ